MLRRRVSNTNINGGGRGGSNKVSNKGNQTKVEPALECCNPKINPAIYQPLFKTTGLITIPNFFTTDFANKYYDFLTKEMQEDWWYVSANPGTGTKVILQNTTENADAIAEVKAVAHQAFSEDKFSYFFYRTYNNHFDKCNCFECEFRKILSSPAFIRLMNSLTGLQLEKNAEAFISRYGGNCFLTVHNDKGNGQIAFVINLTHDWKPQYGGIFHLLTKDRTTIRNTVCPQFNSITIFKVPEPDGVPHYVSHVAPSVTKYRYAVSGWFV